MNTLAFLGNLNHGEILVILLVVVLLFGAKKLPELARSIGQSMKEFRKGREEADKATAEAKTAGAGKEGAGEAPSPKS